jgi:hypothetical protein
MKILSVVGARPDPVGITPILRALAETDMLAGSDPERIVRVVAERL